VGTYGAAFGAAAVAAGFSPVQASVFSLLTFTGGSQFAVVGVIAGGGTAVAALASGWLLGVRNALYGVRMKSILQAHGWREVAAAHVTIDESTAMSITQTEPHLKRVAFWATAIGVFVTWNLSTLAGAFGANALGDPTKFGLDAMVPAAFLALLAHLLTGDPRERRIAFGAAVIALALIPFTPPGVPVISSVAALGLAANLRLLRRSAQ
jgi:predicted branched-subunit amino acid permease